MRLGGILLSFFFYHMLITLAVCEAFCMSGAKQIRIITWLIDVRKYDKHAK